MQSESAVGTRRRTQPLYKNWKYVLDTCNAPEDQPLDTITRTLLIIRACVFQMTITSGLIGGLLAAADVRAQGLPFNGLPFVLALIGLVIAHAVNNMVNDYFDTEGGVDTEDYTRAMYAPHPILSGMITKAGLRNTILAANAIDVVIGIVLTVMVGWPVVIFAALGLLISVFYVAPPIRLKHHGLGEPGVFIVWGPLMIGGAYFVSAGFIRPETFLACIPYALVVSTVLIGKHIDKIDQDKAKHIHTLPVLMGARAALTLNKLLMISFYVITAILILTKIVGPWVALVVFALPRLVSVLKIYSQPKPEKAPEGYVVWPLWFVSWAFHHNKLAGMLFVAGLFINLIAPVQLPF